MKAYKALTNFTKTVEKWDTTVVNQYGYPNVQQIRKIKSEVPAVRLPSWLKNLPKVGQAFEILDLFMGGGKETSAPKPMRFETNLDFKATGIDSTAVPYAPMIINTPGSNKAGLSPANDPNYDNVLGHFNLLNTPRIEFRTDYYYDGFSSPQYDPPWYVDQQYTIRLKEDIQYVINPASGFTNEPHEIQAAIYMHPKFNTDPSTAPGLTLAYLENGQANRPVFRTPFVPLGCLSDYSFSLTQKGEELTESAFPPDWIETHSVDVFIKIRVVLKKTNSPTDDNQKAVFLGKYNANIEETTSSFVVGPMADIPEIAVIDSLTLTQDSLVYAWDSVYLGNEITTNGHHLYVISGGNIEIGNSDLLPEITAEIGSPMGCERKILAADEGQIQAFCNDLEKYNPILERRSHTGPITSPDKHVLAFKAYPNPFEKNIQFAFRLSTSGPVTLTIVNQMGQEILRLLDKEIKPMGSHQLNWDVSNLSSGFYFAVIKTATTTKMIKLAKY